MSGAAIAGTDAAGRPRQALAGVLVGVDHVVHAAALAGLVFGVAALSGAVAAAAALFLVTGAVSTLALAADRALPGPIYDTVQHAPIAILMPAVLAAAGQAASPPVAQATVAAILAGTAVAAGAALLLLAAFDLGRFVRMMPYPVAAGFLAASGALLMVSALGSVMPPEGRALLGGGAAIVPLALAVALALVLAVATAILPNLGMVVVLTGALAGTGLAVVSGAMSPEAARAAGLVSDLALGGAVPAVAGTAAVPPALAAVDWGLVAEALPLMGAAVMIALFGCVLNMSGIELILGRDVASRRVLWRSGASNVAFGALGCGANYPSASATAIGYGLAGPGRLSAFAMCAVAALGAAFAGRIVAAVPPFLAAGLLLFIGGTILNRWFLAQRRTSAAGDWLLIGLIVAVAVVFGVLPAIAVGVVAASVIFAVSYARLPVIRATSDLAARRSRVDRGPAQTAWLDAAGEEVAVVTLQGYLFFGSVEQLTDHARQLLRGDGPVRTVIFDLVRVRAVDAAAVAALRRLDQVARARGGRLVLAGMSPDVARAVARGAVFGSDRALETAPSTDAALEAVEAELLAQMSPPEARENAASAMGRIMGARPLAERLLAQMERIEVAEGTQVIRMGERSEDVFFIDSGRLAVQRPGPRGEPVRLRSLRSGALVGEMASYAGLPRSADVVAEIDTVLYRASAGTLTRLERDDPELAAAWHRMIAVALAEKLNRTNQILQEV